MLDRANELDRINELKAEGKTLHTETFEPMAQEERAQLHRYKYKQMVIFCLFGVVLAAFPFIPASDAPEPWIQKLISAGIILGYGTLMVFYYRRMNHVFSNSNKVIIKGFVTSKKVYSGKNTEYSIIVGEREIFVPRKDYAHYQVGDAAEFHLFTEWSTWLLQHKKIEML